MITDKMRINKPRKDVKQHKYRIYLTARQLDSGKYRPAYEIWRISPSETLSCQSIMKEIESFCEAQEIALAAAKAVVVDLTDYKVVYAKRPNVKKTSKHRSSLGPLPDKSLRNSFDYGVYNTLSRLGMIGGHRV